MSKSHHFQWYLIQAQLPARQNQIEAYVLSQSAKQVQRLPLSVTYKGRLFEIIRLGPQEKLQDVELYLDQEKIDSIPVYIKGIPKAVAYYWMLHRLIWMWHIMPSSLRRRVGFWAAVKGSLYQGYRLLSSFRYHYPAPDYVQWTQRYWSLQPHHKQALQRFMSKSKQPCTLVLDARQASQEDLERSLQAIRNQEGAQVEVVIWQKDLPTIATPYVLYVTAGCVLRPWALAWFAWQQQQTSASKAIYSDHDHYTQPNQWQQPYFKPTWSLELQRGTAYVGEVVWLDSAIFKQQVQRLGTTFSLYAALLDIGTQTQTIEHIAAVLWSAPIAKAELGLNTEQLVQLQQHLKRHCISARAEIDAHGLGRVYYDWPDPQPLVSIIIPTRDMVHLLRPCVGSILQKTQWQNYEIIIVDNQSQCTETLAYMQYIEQAQSRIRVLRYDAVFNYSAINNYAVRQANGSIICLLNNDTEVIAPDWLGEMVSRVMQPKVGVVGARLYYSDGRVQHAGDVVGIGGGATHLHGPIAGNERGYMCRAVAAQDLSAVTAACLVTPKELYLRLGGLNEQQLRVAFNDVDYCLRVRQAGYHVMYTPYAELYHHESVSRGQEDTPEKKARAKAEGDYMRKQWQFITNGDPYYNPNLNQNKADFSLAKAPNINWPWEQ
ncbi:glycosyltransferase family 2 protein [Paenalcaligenes hominis]|uniref:glycosyltransferase family 2 protein n=1 Tax=Paenalcaligenes hominis TaxID=643674 RepID=UPI003526319D